MNKMFKVKDKKYNLKLGGWQVPNLDEIKVIFDLTDEAQEDNKDMGRNLKYEPYPYQKETIKYCLEHFSALLVLPCGAGKSMCIIGAFDEHYRAGNIKKQGLIVVKASLKYQWKKEVEKFSDYTANVLKTKSDLCKKEFNKIKTKEKKQKSLPVLSDEYKQLTAEIKELEKEADEKFMQQFNYDLLIANYEAIKDENIKAALHKLKLDFIAADEVHSIKAYKAERSKALYEFGEAKIKIGATATPIQKNYKDIYGLFKFIKPDLWPSFSRFAGMYIKYVGRGIEAGFKNIDQLRTKISPYLFIKTKEEISSQLPTLNVLQRYCNLDEKIIQKTQSILDEISELHEQERAIIAKCPTEQARENNPDLKQVEAKIMALQTFAQELADEPELLLLSESEMSKQYYVKAKENAKMNLLISLVEEIIDSGEKVCIFSRFERIQQVIAENLSHIKYGKDNIQIAFINGSMNDEQRFNEVYTKFRDTDDYKVLISSDAGSTGLNMSMCKYIIEYDLADSYAIQTQRHGRIERADSIHDNVFVYQLIANDSYDEIAYKIVSKKEGYDYELIKRLKEEN